jgi:hypothetical protein
MRLPICAAPIAAHLITRVILSAPSAEKVCRRKTITCRLSHNYSRKDFNINTRIFPNPKRALLFAGALALLALALLTLPMPRANAQSSGQGRVEGVLVNGTKGSTLTDPSSITVTLYVADMTSQTTITQTTRPDASGHFAFSNIQILTTTRMLATANYSGIDYASDILQFSGITATVPVTLTVYDTTTDPSAVKVAQMHFVIDVQTGTLNVLQIIQVQNGGDRSYIGNTSVGPHHVTLPLPFLAGAANIQFDSQDADSTTIRGTNSMSYTLPFQPGNDQIVFNYSVPFTPPTYPFELKLPWDIDSFQILLAEVGGTITSTQLSAPTNFPTQTGQNFLLSAGGPFTQGTDVKAQLVNLPTTVAAPTSTAPSANTTAPVDNNSQTIGIAVLGLAAVAAILLIAYPLLRRRANRVAVVATNRRMDLLQQIADLDDDFEGDKISESTYKEERARLKAKLQELGDGE